ncbi:MAG: transcriptional regulator NrdR [Bacillota bacterium]
MRCPFCSQPDSKVLESRSTEDGRASRRRRECLKCGRRFSTYERIEGTPIMVLKKDGRREMFDRRKILHGLVRACEKRPVGMEELEKITGDIEQDLRLNWDREVPSKEIGERVMAALQALDEVAYVRFASVYRQFADIERFMAEMENLMTKKKDDAAR